MMTAEKLAPAVSLSSLLTGLARVESDTQVSGVAIDSRQVKPGDLFLAYRGTSHNGVAFIDAAIKAGAVAVAADAEEKLNEQQYPVVIVRVTELRKQAGVIASRFFNEPSTSLNVLGVTGTNGKTTVSFLVAHALGQCQQETAFIGTLGYGRTDDIQDGSMTTPDPVKLQQLFATWCDDMENVVMEVSSHALDQGRVAGVSFDIAVFTNLSRDHLDYHETMEAYAEAKASLFATPSLQHAVINYDDPFGRELIERFGQHLDLVIYSTLTTMSTVPEGTRLVSATVTTSADLITEININSPWGTATIYSSLLGGFNVSNVLAAFSVLCLRGIPVEQAAKSISSFHGVPGRMECFTTSDKALLVVDYAHTPDALEKALESLRPYCQGNLYCVFGCGGDRDMGKRPQMGAVAERHADVVVLTNDNPRNEQPERIVSQILAGMHDKDKVAVRYDRSDAIINTYLQSAPGDIVLIAGKGHETTQTTGDDVLPFSDRELARRLSEESA